MGGERALPPIWVSTVPTLVLETESGPIANISREATGGLAGQREATGGSGARVISNICVLEKVTGPNRGQWEATGGNGMPLKSSDEICIDEYRTHGLVVLAISFINVYIC